jgi:hypothetical protein
MLSQLASTTGACLEVEFSEGQGLRNELRVFEARRRPAE